MDQPRRLSKLVRNGDEEQGLQETAEILSDPDVLSAVEEGLAEIERGDTITFAELRSELAKRRSLSQ